MNLLIINDTAEEVIGQNYFLLYIYLIKLI